ncbi:MAG: hypothetical protein WD770_11180 [Actinomycetota bacterium]
MRGRAITLLAVFGAALVVSGLFWILAEPGIQGAPVDELVRRRSDAVALFTLDYLFVVLYTVAGPIALGRFGTTLASARGRVPSWVALAGLLLVVGGIVDAVENTLLLTASTSGSASSVDLGHALALPKYALGGLGFLLSLRAVWLAVRALRRSGVGG